MRFLIALVTLAPAASYAWTDAPPKPPPIQVPYRLTTTQHVLVRAKINGKGPFNFILDTGAPVLFVSKKTADAAGVTADRRGSATFERFEVEGGVVIDRARAKVDDLFQLEGMNGLGLAGVELHGVIGYNLLACYRIEYDFTRPKLAWTKLDFEPPAVGGIGGRSAPAGLDMVGGMMKFLGGMLGMKATFAVRPRGFLGAELADADGGVIVRAVTPDGPAANAGLRKGDVVVSIAETPVESVKDAAKKLNALPEGDSLALAIRRGETEHKITVELGRGL